MPTCEISQRHVCFLCVKKSSYWLRIFVCIWSAALLVHKLWKWASVYQNTSTKMQTSINNNAKYSNTQLYTWLCFLSHTLKRSGGLPLWVKQTHSLSGTLSYMDTQMTLQSHSCVWLLYSLYLYSHTFYQLLRAADKDQVCVCGERKQLVKVKSHTVRVKQEWKETVSPSKEQVQHWWVEYESRPREVKII